MNNFDENCIFCKIIKGDLPCYKVWEDEKHMGILDLFPTVRGQTLVIPKTHIPSYVFQHMDDTSFTEYFLAAKKVALHLDNKFGTKRTIMIIEGLGINHAHIKLYPVWGITKEFDPEYRGDGTAKPDGKYFKLYPGYITTLNGPRLSEQEAESLLKLLIK